MGYMTRIVRSLHIRIPALRPTALILGAVLLLGVSANQFFGAKTSIKAHSLRPAQSSILHQVENQTASVQVIAADIFGETNKTSLRLVLKNNSPNKRLTAYAVSFGDPQGWVEHEYLFSENPTDIYPPGSIITNEFGGIERKRPITILCAVFEGGTFEGNVLQASNIINQRFGQRLLLSKALTEIMNIRGPFDQEESDARITSAIEKVRGFEKPSKQELELYLQELVPPGNLDTIEGQVARGFNLGKQYLAQKIERVRIKKSSQGLMAPAGRKSSAATRLDELVSRIQQMRDSK